MSSRILARFGQCMFPFSIAIVLAILMVMPGEANAQNQTVRVVFEKILMIDDSDDLSDAEMCFAFWANHGKPGGKGFGLDKRMGSGHSYSLNRTLEIDNAPDELIVHVDGEDDDSSGLFGLVDRECDTTPGPPSTTISRNTNYANAKFNLTKFPGTNVSQRLVLPARTGGGVRFTVYGRVEITRTPPPRATISGKTVNTDPGEMTTIRTIPGKPPRTVRKIGKTKFYGSYITTTPYGVFEMVLSSGGSDKVTGTFSGNGSTGTISGTLFGDTLIFRWSQDGGKYKGTGKFVLADNGQSFTGTFSNSNDPNDTSAGQWNGRRK